VNEISLSHQRAEYFYISEYYKAVEYLGVGGMTMGQPLEESNIGRMPHGIFHDGGKPQDDPMRNQILVREPIDN
jgi:hypothetical protein